MLEVDVATLRIDLRVMNDVHRTHTACRLFFSDLDAVNRLAYSLAHSHAEAMRGAQVSRKQDGPVYVINIVVQTGRLDIARRYVGNMVQRRVANHTFIRVG